MNRGPEQPSKLVGESCVTTEASFRAVFEAAPVGIGIVGAAGADKGRLVRVNAALARLLGHPPESLEGTPFAKLSHPDDREVVMPYDAERAVAGTLETRLLHANGRAIAADIHYSLVRDDTPAPYFIARIEDIGARRESEHALLDALEQQNHAASHLAKIDEVRTEMVATISHELRTPLTSIGGYLEVLIDGDLGELSDDQIEVLNRASAATRRLADLADNLLVLARLDEAEATGAAVDRIVVDACTLVTDAVEAITPTAAAREQSVDMDVPRQAVHVRGNQAQLARALGHILANASKYTPNGGHLRVTVHLGDAEVHISTSDDGLGIPLDEQEKLFERFFRASDAQELAIRGTGLGLAIVKSIVERHGGRVKVDSAKNVGSTFTITLPTVGTTPWFR